MPARGATAMALTEPQSKLLPAAVQLAAPFVVRHMRSPPVHRICGLFGDMTNGVMNRKPWSRMPAMASTKCAPPSTDFVIDSPVVSA